MKYLSPEIWKKYLAGDLSKEKTKRVERILKHDPYKEVCDDLTEDMQYDAIAIAEKMNKKIGYSTSEKLSIPFNNILKIAASIILLTGVITTLLFIANSSTDTPLQATSSFSPRSTQHQEFVSPLLIDTVVKDNKEQPVTNQTNTLANQNIADTVPYQPQEQPTIATEKSDSTPVEVLESETPALVLENDSTPNKENELENFVEHLSNTPSPKEQQITINWLGASQKEGTTTYTDSENIVIQKEIIAEIRILLKNITDNSMLPDQSSLEVTLTMKSNKLKNVSITGNLPVEKINALENKIRSIKNWPDIEQAGKTHLYFSIAY